MMQCIKYRLSSMGLFPTTNGHPGLGQLLESVHAASSYDIAVSADIIRLTPRHGSAPVRARES